MECTCIGRVYWMFRKSFHTELGFTMNMAALRAVGRPPEDGRATYPTVVADYGNTVLKQLT